MYLKPANRWVSLYFTLNIIDLSIYIVYTVTKEGSFNADNYSEMGQQPGGQDS